MKIAYRILLVVFLLDCFIVNAQNGTSSPYSMYGVGDIKPYGFGRNMALGGAGIALPSKTFLNNINPASYFAIDSLEFRFETGLDARFSKFTNNVQSQHDKSVNFSYMAMGFRNTPWWANSFGLAPFSSVGNKIATQRNIEGTQDYVDVSVEGSGGLTQLYWGNSFRIGENLSLGVNLSFLFGTMAQNQYMTAASQNSSANSFTETLQVEDKTYMSKLYLNYGALYSFKINDKLKGTLGGIFAAPCKLNLRHELSASESLDTIFSDNTTQETSFTIPRYYGLGASFTVADILLITGDYKFQNWSASKLLTARFANTNSYHVGIEYTPSVSVRATYFQKVKYRVGGYYSDYYLMINGKQLSDKGLSLGFGVPMLHNRLHFNVAYQYGIKGGATGAIDEKYHGIMINVSMTDLWFFKPKFD